MTLAWMSLASSTLFACFSPNLEGAECIGCAEGWCPGDLECVRGRCVLPGSSKTCDGPGGTGAHSAANGGGAGAAGFGTGGLAGRGGVRGIAGSSSIGGTSAGEAPAAGGAREAAGGTTGEGGASGDDGGSLEMDVITTSPLCAGRDIEVTFTVDSGRAPYDWAADFDSSAFSFASHGTTATLRGAPPAAGDYVVKVRVTDVELGHNERQLTLSVKATPAILTEKVPPVCADEIYSAELNAEGGDVSKYTWSSSLARDTGLAVLGARIEGRFNGWPVGARFAPFTLSLESEGCVADPVELVLAAAPRTECPVISVEGGMPTLPPPCAGSAYSARLRATGGEGSDGYTWRALQAPAGLGIGETTGVLSGIAEEGGALSIEVEDGAGRTIAASYVLEPRTKCWLAYLAEEDGPSKLHLFDALLDNRHVFSAGVPTALVADFRFSLDGRFLAYRAGAPPGELELVLVELATMRTQVVGFEDVRQYAWSQDGSTLAVAYAPDGSPVLGGLRVRASGTVSGELYSELQPTPADVSSAPIWFGPSQLAFLNSIGHAFPAAAMANLGELGFSGPQIHPNSFSLDTRMQSAERGFFAIPTDDASITFYPADGSPGKLHANVIVAPSGRYTALSDGGRLQIFEDVDESRFYPDEIAPYASAAGCDAILAWSESRERIACRHSAGGVMGVNLFELGRQTAELSGPFPMRMKDQAELNVAALQAQRRIFSHSAEQFAFATNEGVYVAKIVPTDSGIEFAYTVSLANAPDSVLAFSPDERMLLAHRGTRLTLFRLESPIQGAVLTDLVLPAPPCSEDGYSAVAQFCGEVSRRGISAWSPDSGLLAIATPPGALTVVDVRSPDYGFRDAAATARCSGECFASDHFAFQP